MNSKWPLVSLGSVANLVGGGTPSKSNPDFWDGDTPWASVRDMKDRWLSSTQFSVTNDGVRASATHVIPKGNVVVATRVGLGKVVQVEQPTAINQDLRAIIPKATAKLDPNFIFYWYQTVSKQVISAGTGATVQGVKIPTIANLQIPLPPLDEQKRIVAKLDEVNTGVEKALQKYVTEIVCYEILWRKELKSLMMAGDQRRPRVRIGDVCVLKSGKTVSKEIERSHGEIPYLKVADMNLIENANKIVTSSRFLMFEDVKPSQIMPPGTTIFPKRGGAIATNKKRITSVPICVDLNVMGVIPGPLVSPKMLYYFFAGIDMRDLGDGSSIPQINNPDIAPLEMMLPDSISEQDAITERLDVIQSKINTLSGLVTKKRVQLEALGIAVGEEAFRRGI